MTDDGSKLLHSRTEFDGWRFLTIGIYMALAGYTVMVGLPVISTSWVEYLGFSEVEEELLGRPLLSLQHCAKRCTAESRDSHALHQLVDRTVGLFNRGLGHGVCRGVVGGESDVADALPRVDPWAMFVLPIDVPPRHVIRLGIV